MVHTRNEEEPRRQEEKAEKEMRLEIEQQKVLLIKMNELKENQSTQIEKVHQTLREQQQAVERALMERD